jgi:hypothetical protein
MNYEITEGCINCGMEFLPEENIESLCTDCLEAKAREAVK